MFIISMAFIVVLIPIHFTRITNDIVVRDLSEFLLVDSNFKPLSLKGNSILIDSFSCKEPNDTLFSNVLFSYDGMLENLHKEFLNIDKVRDYNKHTKNYIKALITADLVYAAFSYELDLGFRDSLEEAVQVSDLKDTYQKGVQNKITLYCRQRAVFYSTLVSKLLGLETRVKDIAGVHSFPLVTIGEVEYLIDPYDPYIVTDTKGVVLGYNKLLDDNTIIYHSKRQYGNTHNLISATTLVALTGDDKYCGLIDYFKKRNLQFAGQELIIADNLKDCKVVCSSAKYKFALPTVGRPFSVFIIDKKVLREMYFGIK